MILTTAPEMLGALERGDVAKDWAAAIHRVLEACQQLDEAKGSVSLKLSIDVKGELCILTAKIDETTPKKKRRSSNFFLTHDAQISMKHPDQIDMEFQRHRGRAEAQDV